VEVTVIFVRVTVEKGAEKFVGRSGVLWMFASVSKIERE
jgi:hypothetical protein